MVVYGCKKIVKTLKISEVLSSKVFRVPISINYFWEKIQTLFQFSWDVVFCVKVFNCCCLKTFYTAQTKLVRNGFNHFGKRVLSYSHAHQ